MELQLLANYTEETVHHYGSLIATQTSWGAVPLRGAILFTSLNKLLSETNKPPETTIYRTKNEKTPRSCFIMDYKTKNSNYYETYSRNGTHAQKCD